MLADELGLEPGPELRRLQEAILAHDPAIAAVPVDRRRRGNLPAPSTSFVGREEELGQVAALLHEHRLVTLTGPPGVGKSRLAVEAARSLEHEFPDGIWLVDFARAGGADDAVRLLAHAVDVRGSDPLARVTSRLRDAERARSSSTRASTSSTRRRGSPRRCSRSVPRVRILATSREALHVAGEVRLPVAPLAGRGRRALPRACARGAARLRAGRRGRRARRRDRPARGRAAARDRARRRARERARARGARLHPRAARGAPARQPGLRPEPHRAARARRMELRPPARGREDAAPAARRPPRRRVPRRRSSRSQRRTASTRRPSRISSPRWSTSRSCRRRSPAAPPATTCSTRSASTCSSVSPRAAGSPPPAARTPSTSRRWPTRRASGCAGRTGCAGNAACELENDNLWAALAYARDAPDPAVAVRLGTLGWYFALAERVSEGRRFLELALVRDGRRRCRSSCGSSCSPTSATSRPRSSISTRRSRPASARSRSPRPLRRRGSAASRS